MSEFKFACSVCGQHITADSSNSGGQVECPTCFQKIVVPQASSADSKFILSASQVGKPRPTSVGVGAAGDLAALPSRSSRWVVGGLVFTLVAAATAAVVFREKLFKPGAEGSAEAGTKADARVGSVQPHVVHPVPTNIHWSLEMAKASIPDAEVVGGIHGNGFVYERATLQGGNLTLRQGKTWPPDLGVSIQLFAQQGEELSGKSIEIAPDRSPPQPKVVLRWKNDEGHAQTMNVPGGYALKLSFGTAANGRIPGRLYLALPDDEKSFVAGTFDAEIRKPNPPRQPKQPKAGK